MNDDDHDDDKDDDERNEVQLKEIEDDEYVGIKDGRYLYLGWRQFLPGNWWLHFPFLKVKETEQYF